MEMACTNCQLAAWFDGRDKYTRNKDLVVTLNKSHGLMGEIKITCTRNGIVTLIKS